MSDKTIVVVYDERDKKHGEVTVLEDAAGAAHHVESLLESGIGQDRIRIYTGNEMEMKVSHRPVVALVGGDIPEQFRKKSGDAPDDNDEADTEQALPRAKSELKGAEANAAPGVKDGVRLSPLFRSS